MNPKIRYLVNLSLAKVARLVGAQFSDMSVSDSKKIGQAKGKKIEGHGQLIIFPAGRTHMK